MQSIYAIYKSINEYIHRERPEFDWKNKKTSICLVPMCQQPCNKSILFILQMKRLSLGFKSIYCLHIFIISFSDVNSKNIISKKSKEWLSLISATLCTFLDLHFISSSPQP